MYSTAPQIYGVMGADSTLSEINDKDLKKDSFLLIYAGVNERVGVLIYAENLIKLKENECAVHPDVGIKIGDKVVFSGKEYTVTQSFPTQYEILLPSKNIDNSTRLNDITFYGKNFSQKNKLATMLSSAFPEAEIILPEKMSYITFIAKTPLMVFVLGICFTTVFILAFCINFLISQADRQITVLRFVGYSPKDILKQYSLMLFPILFALIILSDIVYVTFERFVLSNASLQLAPYFLMFSDYIFVAATNLFVIALLNIRQIKVLLSKKIEVAQ